jgi:tRNA threonylcarbamoyladenosine biosynthesis protein TsaE
MRLYHLDLYRIEGGADEIYELGLDELLAEPDAVVVIEWAERLAAFAISHAYVVSIEDCGDEKRRIIISFKE